MNTGLQAPGSGSQPPRPIRRLLLVSAGVLAAWVLANLFIITPTHPLTVVFFFGQDLPWLMIIAAVTAWLAFVPEQPFWTAAANLALCRPNRALAAIAALVVLVTFAGSIFVYRGYALSRDEVMADFDASIYAQGRFVAPVAPEWRPFVPALLPTFRLPIPGNAAWVSGYLPINAAFRAIFATLATPRLTNAVLAGLAVFALFRVARRLWPDRPDAALVAVLLLATSSQVLITAMTPYAMTGHLALNLVWLWLFLRDDRKSMTLAVCVGFLACGLHQLIFHLLFVAPFMLQLLLKRRWQTVGFYAAAYASISVFWIAYWPLALMASHIAPDSSVAAAGFMARAVALMKAFEWSGLDLMDKNLLRFIGWQNPLLVPLSLLGIGSLWKSARSGVLWPLAGGIGLTLLAVFVLLPYQGHGWGYRYLHGLLGSFSLLAAEGWIAATGLPHSDRRGLATVFGWAGLFSIVLLLPGRAYQVAAFIAPSIAATDSLRHASADIVIVDGSELGNAPDLVRNEPFLQNRPKVLDLRFLNDALIRDICGRFKVEIFDREQGAALGLPVTTPLSAEDLEHHVKLRALMKSLSCEELVTSGGAASQ